jgi:hypothetical protein
VNCKSRELLEAMRIERSLAASTPAQPPTAERASVTARLARLLKHNSG